VLVSASPLAPPDASGGRPSSVRCVQRLCRTKRQRSCAERCQAERPALTQARASNVCSVNARVRWASHPSNKVDAVTIPDRYDAFWIPGPDRLDIDAGLQLGYAWLDVTTYPGERVVVVATKSMLGKRPMLARAGRYHVVSPRARDIPYMTAGAVLAIWPSAETLELAQTLALDSALCAIPYRHDITWWIARTGATNLADPEAQTASLAPLDPVVTDRLDSILSFGGSNGFVGAGEKEDAVRGLRAILTAGQRPSPHDVEGYARASGETDIDGARRLRGFYEKIFDGRGLRDGRGRSI
jgi:hypothetical protein